MPPISMPGMERAEPRPMPPSKPATKAGLPKRSFSRPATMPTTPGCQPSPDTRMNGALACVAASAMASSRICFSIAWRSRLCRSSCSGEFAGLLAVARGQQIDAQRRAPDAAAGIDARPEDKAQMIGRERRLRPRRRRPAPPGRAATAATAAPRPKRTKARLTPISGTTSQIVASPTRSRYSRRSGSAMPRCFIEAAVAQMPVQRHQEQEASRPRRTDAPGPTCRPAGWD